MVAGAAHQCTKGSCARPPVHRARRRRRRDSVIFWLRTAIAQSRGTNGVCLLRHVNGARPARVRKLAASALVRDKQLQLARGPSGEIR
jgi:hypothetical protein